MSQLQLPVRGWQNVPPLDVPSPSGASRQVCPLGPTGFGDSPYQGPSAFAGNPYLIDVMALAGD